MQDDVVQKTRWLGQKIGILVKDESSDEESDDEDVDDYDEEAGIEEEDEDDIDYSEDRMEIDKRTLSSGGSSSREKDEEKTKNRR